MELEEFNSILIPINLNLNSNLIKLRKNYKLFAISHFINLFKKHINFEFNLVVSFFTSFLLLSTFYYSQG